MTLEHHSYYTTVKIEIQPLFGKSKDLLIYITGCGINNQPGDLSFSLQCIGKA